jgi:hypothetical protein
MLWPPAVSAVVAQVALPALTVCAVHPAMALPPFVKPTVPVGALPVTVAVMVTLAPSVDGLGELARVVALAALPTPCTSAGLADPALLASPLYVATMLWLPTVSAAVVQVAFAATTPCAVQMAMALPLSVKPTVPVGALPVIVAVKVTLAPGAEGFAELVSAVEVAGLLEEDVSETASMKVDMSALATVPAKVMVCAPVVATENGMLNAVKLVLGGVTRLPIWVPSMLTLMGCTLGAAQHERCAAWNASV